MIVAGEASGDKHGASLARALAQLHPEIKFQLFGSGGEDMRAAGVETLVDAREVGIIGVLEIARAIGKLYRAYRTLLSAARSRRPSAVVLIDWPDFNMRLARKLHREGFKIIYYVSPQVWAWRRYRIRALRRDVDRMLVILPFEEEFYKRSGLEVKYVGHPLSEVVCTTASREDFCRTHGLDPARPIFALLPGSRHKEIHFHLPAMLDAAIRLRSFPVGNRDSGLRNQERPVAHEASNQQSQISNLKSAIRGSARLNGSPGGRGRGNPGGTALRSGGTILRSGGTTLHPGGTTLRPGSTTLRLRRCERRSWPTVRYRCRGRHLQRARPLRIRGRRKRNSYCGGRARSNSDGYHLPRLGVELATDPSAHSSGHFRNG